jgi:hypothetical protein
MKTTTLILSFALAFASLTFALPERAAATQADHSLIGFSQLGIPLVIYHLGQGDRSLLIMGGQHGGPEGNTVRLANMLWEHFTANPSEIPSNVRLDFLPEANPDGLARGSRLFVSGVDPNRNWGGPDWATDAWDSNGVFRIGLGGNEPFSERETQATRDYILAQQPSLTINYHSRGGFMFSGRGERSARFSEAYSTASRFPRPTAGPGGGGSPLSYRATGSMNVWMGDQGLAAFLIELTTYDDPEFARNLAGVRAVLSQISQE